jgi:hypothetical protein
LLTVFSMSVRCTYSNLIPTELRIRLVPKTLVRASTIALSRARYELPTFIKRLPRARNPCLKSTNPNRRRHSLTPLHTHANPAATTTRVDKQILSNAVATVTAHAESRGLDTSEIDRLVSVLVVVPQRLDRGNVGQLVRGLVPRGKVAEDTAVKVIACVGLGRERAPLQTQVYAIGVPLM